MRVNITTAGTISREIPGEVDKNGGADVRPVGSGKSKQADGGRLGGYPSPNRRTLRAGTAPPAAKVARHVSVAVSSTASVPSSVPPLSTTP